jgi:hypothetical protein
VFAFGRLLGNKFKDEVSTKAFETLVEGFKAQHPD